MTANNNDRIIELYLDGALSPAEEHEVRALLEVDPDLRRLLDAELAVRRTFASDADAIPVETERSYARFLAALATTSTAADGDATGAAVRTGGAPTGGWMTSSFAKFAGAGVVAIGLAVGGYLVLDDDQSEGSRRGSNAAAGATSLHGQTAPASPSGHESTTDVTNGAATTDVAPPSSSSRAAAASDARIGNAASTKRTHRGEPVGPQALADPHDDLTEIERATQDEDDLPIIENDSVSARINIRFGDRR